MEVAEVGVVNWVLEQEVGGVALRELGGQLGEVTC